MTGREAIKSALQSTQNLLKMYVGDLSDADLLVRPRPNANHIAWQLGHLISSEAKLTKVLPGAISPELPAGFAERYTKETSKNDNPKDFRPKAEYLSLFTRVRQATIAN